MPLPTFDKLDEIPESFRSEYEEREDPATPGVKKWHAKVPDVTKLQSALESERTRAATEERARRDAERTATELRREAEAKKAGISDEQLQKIRADEEAARKPLNDELAAIRTENRQLKLNDKARALATKSGVMPDRLDDAMDLVIGRRLDLSSEGNMIVKDAAGSVTATSPEDFFKTVLKAEKEWLYAGTGSSGAGSSGSTVAGGTATSGAKTPQQIGKDMNDARAARGNPFVKPAVAA